MVAAALELASVIVEFVGFSIEFTRVLHDVADRGTTRGNVAIGQSTQHLRSITVDLSKAIEATLGSSGPLKADTIEYELAIKCRATAERLLSVLGGLTLETNANRIEIFVTGAKAIWRKSDIEAIQKELRTYQEMLDTAVLRRIRALVVANQHVLRDTNERTRALATALYENKITIDGLSDLIVNRVAVDLSSIRILLQDKIDTERQIQFLKSLRFADMDLRYKSIHEKHGDTFEWIYSGQASSPPPYTAHGATQAVEHNTLTRQSSRNARHRESNFSQWLRGNSTRYWISGKLGSGKSTLMKSLSKSDRPRQLLLQWHGNKVLIIVSFYFWAAGTPDQKNLSGLLRSLIHQLLSNRGRTIDEILKYLDHERIVDLADVYTRHAWTCSELKLVLDLALKLLLPDHCVVFMLDGLDEYDDSQYTRLDLFDIIRQLSARPGVKVCVSSRPEQVFRKEFQHDEKLKLEELTLDDITTYITDRLVKYPYYQSLVDENHARLEQLLQRLAKKSQGVFLWVALIVKELENAFAREDKFKILEETVDQSPQDLDTLYAEMLGKITKPCQEEAACFFHFKLDHFWKDVHRLTVLDYLKLQYPLDFQEILGDSDVNETKLKFDGEERSLLDMIKLMEKQIANRCMGMLECHWEHPEEKIRKASFQAPQKIVSFIHLSAVDFFRNHKAGQDFLKAWPAVKLGCRYIDYAFADLAIASLGQVPSPLEQRLSSAYHPPDVVSVGVKVWWSIFAKPELTRQNLTELLEHLESRCSTFSDQSVYWSLVPCDTMIKRIHDPVSFAAWWGIQWYVEENLDSSMSQVDLNHLLQCAVQGLQIDLHYRKSVSDHLQLIRILLLRGAEPNYPAAQPDVWSIWHRALFRLAHIRDRDLKSSHVHFNDFLQMIEQFMAAGAHMSEPIYETFKYQRINKDNHILAHVGICTISSPLAFLVREASPDRSWLKKVISLLKVHNLPNMQQISKLRFSFEKHNILVDLTFANSAASPMMQALFETLSPSITRRWVLVWPDEAIRRKAFEIAWNIADSRTLTVSNVASHWYWCDDNPSDHCKHWVPIQRIQSDILFPDLNLQQWMEKLSEYPRLPQAIPLIPEPGRTVSLDMTKEFQSIISKLEQCVHDPEAFLAVINTVANSGTPLDLLRPEPGVVPDASSLDILAPTVSLPESLSPDATTTSPLLAESTPPAILPLKPSPPEHLSPELAVCALTREILLTRWDQLDEQYDEDDQESRREALVKSAREQPQQYLNVYLLNLIQQHFADVPAPRDRERELSASLGDVKIQD